MVGWEICWSCGWSRSVMDIIADDDGFLGCRCCSPGRAAAAYRSPRSSAWLWMGKMGLPSVRSSSSPLLRPLAVGGEMLLAVRGEEDEAADHCRLPQPRTLVVACPPSVRCSHARSPNFDGFLGVSRYGSGRRKTPYARCLAVVMEALLRSDKLGCKRVYDFTILLIIV
ncbi:hypothetical protein ACLOJK_002408 [Asimina triloba]